MRRANRPGIELDYTARNTIRGNDVRFNRGGINLGHARENVIERDNTSRSGGDGIVVADLSYENVVRKNISNHNDGAGVIVAVAAGSGRGALIEDNAAHGNDTHYTRLNPGRQTRRLIAQLERLGHTVTLQEAAQGSGVFSL